ncbi:hypothetical protein NDU88_006750 [Pleurodeles waltl]|uniref:Uncharacterized protein n=1 Tax=Pleurodeles waltl TaxID=8319 RepID=A0AAV7N293_PLEWA|nr:hypothetical protein NDU88_006750 [Pleurodeles waltl]
MEHKVMSQQETLDESFEKESSASPKEDRGCVGYKEDNPPVDQPHDTVLKDYEHNMLLLQQKQLKTQMRICSQLRGIRKSISEIPKAMDRLAAPMTSLYRSMNNLAQGSHNMSIRFLGLNCEMVRANTSISQSLERITEAFELVKSLGHEAEAAAEVASHHTELQDSTEESPQGNANL